jgi:hypothetical protein
MSSCRATNANTMTTEDELAMADAAILGNALRGIVG